MSIAGVTRELLVRYLDTWAPGALHSGRRATFAQAWDRPPDVASTEAAVRVFAEFADRLRGRRLTMVLVAPAAGDLGARLAALQAELGTPAQFAVHLVSGGGDALLPVALTAAGAAGAPVLAYVDTDGAPPFGAVSVGRPAEVMLVTSAHRWDEHRVGLRAAGFDLTAAVELVGAAEPVGARVSRLVAFGTSSTKSLEAFKNALWAVDEYAGVRYRDPSDPEGHLLDISLNPDPGPLRRELLAHLAAVGACSVTELRRYALTETVYRASDTVRAVTAMVTSGAVTRRPEHGRLGGDVVIALPGTAPPGG